MPITASSDPSRSRLWDRNVLIGFIVMACLVTCLLAVPAMHRILFRIENTLVVIDACDVVERGIEQYVPPGWASWSVASTEVYRGRWYVDPNVRNYSMRVGRWAYILGFHSTAQPVQSNMH
jgi:hypothetical protein